MRRNLKSVLFSTSYISNKLLLGDLHYHANNQNMAYLWDTTSHGEPSCHGNAYQPELHRVVGLGLGLIILIVMMINIDEDKNGGIGLWIEC